jgi:hypothetical protein
MGHANMPWIRSLALSRTFKGALTVVTATTRNITEREDFFLSLCRSAKSTSIDVDFEAYYYCWNAKEGVTLNNF